MKTTFDRKVYEAARKAYWAARYQQVKAERHAAKPPDPIEALDATTLAYIAGLLDGEGCITITRNSKSRVDSPFITFIMTHEGVMRWLGEKLGSKCSPLKRKNVQPHWKPQFKVCLGGRRAVRLLKRLLPMMIVKAPQAAVAVEFPYIVQDGKSRRVPDDVLAVREAMKVEISRLNDRRRLHTHVHDDI